MAYILFDAHNFFVSAELVFRPDLLGKPVVVIGSNDGCVISRSQRAKDIGIAMGEPAHFVRREFYHDDVRFFSANFPLYGDMSARMMACIQPLVPSMTPFSIDEVFAHCKGMNTEQLLALATQVRDQVFKFTGLPIGAGIGNTHTLAKLASYLAKRVYRTDVYAINSNDERIAALRITPVGEVWGVGPAYKAKLIQAGIKTALDLALADPSIIAQQFPVGMRRTQLELNGTTAVDIGDPSTPRKMINVSRSFGAPIDKICDLSPAFASFAMTACEKLNRQQSVAGALRVYLRPASSMDIRSSATTVTFKTRTCDPRVIASAAAEGISRLFRTGVAYGKGGICLLDMDQPGSAIQSSLFETDDVDGNRVAEVVAGINERFGRGTLSVASSLGSPRWKPRCEFHSGTSSTRISGLPVVF